MFSNGRDDWCCITIVISKYFRTEKSDCDDKLAGAPSDVWLKLGVGGCTRPRQFVDLATEGNTIECSLI